MTRPRWWPRRPGDRRQRRRSQRVRLTAAFALISVLAAATVGVLATTFLRRALLDRAQSQAVSVLRADLREAGAALVGGEPDETLGTVRVLGDDALVELGSRLDRDDGSELVVLQPGSAPTYTSSSRLDAADVPTELRDQVATGVIATVRVVRDDVPELVVGGRVAGEAAELYRLVSLEPVEQDLALVGRTLALAGLVPVGAALLVGWFAASQVLVPVRRARDAARRVAAGWLETRVPVEGDDELAELADALNEMTSSLSATIEQLRDMEAHQRRFVADVSHELRTPLTALVAAVDVLEEEGARDTEDRRQALGLVVSEVRAVRRLVDDLMEMSRLDAGAAPLSDGEVLLRTLVDRAIARRGWTARIEVDVPVGWLVRVDQRRADAIVANLVGNAVEHARPPVRVTATPLPGGLAVDVTDAGPGIPPGVGDRAFDRFVKADAARTRSGGSGLGLAIARENARLHGGDVVLQRTGPAGTTLRWTLPADRVEQLDVTARGGEG
ncbi:HAMP domain-containing histidine kinase [Nitriliruptoraceae bacterium ZYF776]|nr:HAMP domain-containing histidine kinase [Profundirhabdus halotolerans]